MEHLSRVSARIDLDALCHNVRLAQEKAGADVKLLAVIKANGYGHGALQLARTLSRRNRVYGFGVATVPEGIELRRGGIAEPILVLGRAFPESYPDVVRYGLTQTVFREEDAAALSQAAAGGRARVHIKLDTGMGRIGFLPTEASMEAILRIAGMPGIEVEGIFSHFACADERDKASADRQFALFQAFTAGLEGRGLSIPCKHICNSAGVLEFDDRYLDMVRLGIMAYGIYPSGEVSRDRMPVRPVMSLVSHLSHVKRVPPGTPVSYGSTYVTDAERVIATVPVGYGDGYPRSLSGKGRVLVRGASAPIVGRVCMDQFMVDVTHIPDACTGDEAVLVGEQGSAAVTVEELSALSGRFHYEFVCDISRRVPRVYLERGEIVEVVDDLMAGGETV